MQGPTSSGKTSLVAYLAAQTGHKFVRINNHEQTDLQVNLMAPRLHFTVLLWTPPTSLRAHSFCFYLTLFSQEYLGSYVSDESGRLIFQEGLLVQVRRCRLRELRLPVTEACYRSWDEDAANICISCFFPISQ